MSYEKKLLARIVDSIYSSDFCDNIVVARLTDSLNGVLDDLESLNKKTELLEHHRIDFVDNLEFARSLVGVLGGFTTNDYQDTMLQLDKYEDRFMPEY
jgi:uncharacterized protein YbcI